MLAMSGGKWLLVTEGGVGYQLAHDSEHAPAPDPRGNRGRSRRRHLGAAAGMGGWRRRENSTWANHRPPVLVVW